MSSFQTTLDKLHRSRITVRLLLLALTLLALYGLGMLLHGLADYQWALSPAVRKAANAALWITLAVIGVIWIVRIFRTPRTVTAALADAALGDDRRRSLSATYLEAMEADTEMKKFHLDRALDDAGKGLEKLPLKARFPMKALGLGVFAVLLLGGVIVALKSAAPAPFDVVSQRVLNPAADMPPYSPLIFKITPDNPNALYGGEAVVQVDITGGEIVQEVYCLIRDVASGRVEKTTTFREDVGKYARKFENALAPVEFAFATGRARSEWRKLDVLFQPRVSNAQVTITPPAYTGRKALSYPLDSGEIKALEGSTVKLTLQSNRPLAGGEMLLHTMDNNDEALPEVVAADVTGDQEVTFTWTARRSSRLSALIKDVRSTPAEKPLELTLKAVPDQVPVVELSEPQPMVLATPKSELPLVGDVSDDHGLAKVSLVRSLVGYRDRSRLLADALVKKMFNFKEPVKLEELGVEPGQTLEFYMEASDRNPSLLGVGVSDVVRVRIISEEDYAERIRNKFQLNKFTARYRALADALRESREALEKMDEAADLGKKEALEKARKQAEKAHAKAEDLATKLAKDFKAFDMEGRLKDAAQNAADKLAQNRKQMQGMNLDAGEAKARKAIKEMQERLGGAQKQADQVAQDAEMMKKAGKVMEMAAEYRRMINAQKSIVERLREIAKEVAMGKTDNTNRLEGLARVQNKNRESLLKFAKDLKKRADDLPEELGQMKADVDEFLSGLEKMDIPNPMRTASEAAKKGKSTDAFTNALLSLNLMEQLLEKPKNGF